MKELVIDDFARTEGWQAFASGEAEMKITVEAGALRLDFDFHGGHITISGAFEPAINLSAYNSFATQNTDLSGLHALAGLDQDGYSLGLACADGNELVDVDVSNSLRDDGLACYSTKPNWHRTNLIPSLEDAAEQYHAYMNHAQTARGHDGLQTQHTLAGPSPALSQ
ncbi:MAG: hypothetical protein EOP83_00110, partial [Verrucomicrobiaceae bacterium]